MSIKYEHCIIRGIPYYRNGTSIYTFDTKSEPVSIGTYDTANDSITYFADWRERCKSSLATFRSKITAQERDKLRESITKPAKPRKTTRNPRKAVRAKDTKSE